MPDAQGRLFAREIAERIGISVGDWRARVRRQFAPEPVDKVVDGAYYRPVWDPALIERYVAGRPLRLDGKAAAVGDHRLDCCHATCDVSAMSWAALNQHIRDAHLGGKP